MAEASLASTAYRAQSKLGDLRRQIQASNFQVKEDIEAYVNRYVSANPNEVKDRSNNSSQELIGNIRSELGLAAGAVVGSASAIGEQVQALVKGHAQATEDSTHWSVHQGTANVSTANGQFVFDATQIFVEGAGIDFVFHVTYKNQGYYNGPLGINWDHSYNLGLRVLDGGNRLVRLTGGFRESEYLKHPLYDYWTPPPGEHDILVRVTDAVQFGIRVPSGCQLCQYVLRTANGMVTFYEPDGQGSGLRLRVKQIEDVNGNYLRFSYKSSGSLGVSLLDKVEINHPRRIVTFEAYDQRGRILRMRDHLQRKWRYKYDDWGDLIAFTTPGTKRYASGLTEKYEYSSAKHVDELAHNLLRIYDTAGRLHISNKYGTSRGLLAYNRVVEQREGSGVRYFGYEDISLKTGAGSGVAGEVEELPAQQTIITRRNGHPVHYIYNRYGHLIAREEDMWRGGIRRRLVSHYRYNRDGAITDSVSAEGRIVQYLNGRDDFVQRQGLDGDSEAQLRDHAALTWQKRLSFGNLLAIVRRGGPATIFSTFQFPTPLTSLSMIKSVDIVVKYAYEPLYQGLISISDPRHTNSAFANTQADSNARFKATLTRLTYMSSEPSRLEEVIFPDSTREGQPERTQIRERFIQYDGRGRIEVYENQLGTRTAIKRYPQATGPSAVDDLKEGFVKEVVVDPRHVVSNPDGLDLSSLYDVNNSGNVTKMTTPDGQMINFELDSFNRVIGVKRALNSGVSYSTRYMYCRNRKIERIERDVRDEKGQPLQGGVEVQLFAYDENDNLKREQFGGLDVEAHLVTKHRYDDGDLRTSSTLPRGNKVRIRYDARRLPRKITRGPNSEQQSAIRVWYDGDGLLIRSRDGLGHRTSFDYDGHGRLVSTKQYDAQNTLLRLIRNDYDKADNLICERVFKPGSGGDYLLLFHACYDYDEHNDRIERRVRYFSAPKPYKKGDVQRDDDDISDAEAIVTRYYYDASGEVIRTEAVGRRRKADGSFATNNTTLVTTFEYNAAGWMTAYVDPAGNRTELQHDEVGQVVRADVREKVVGSATGEEVFTTLYDYDNLGRLERIIDGMGNITTYRYDSRDAITRQIDTLGNVTDFVHDIYGRRIEERVSMTANGLGTGVLIAGATVVTKEKYDANGNLVEVIDANGNATRQVFDDLDRRIEVRYPDGTAHEYAYDQNSNIVWERDNNGLVKRTTYDVLSHPISISVERGGLKPGVFIGGSDHEHFEYDELGRMTRAKNAWADSHFKHDSLGRIYEERCQLSGLNQSLILRREFDEFGFVRRVIYPSGRIIGYEPDNLNRVERVINLAYGNGYPGESSAAEQRWLSDHHYVGLRHGLRRFGNGCSNKFDYDASGRVKEIRHLCGLQSMHEERYLYDAAGNMRRKWAHTGSGTDSVVYHYDSLYRLTHHGQGTAGQTIFSPAGPPQTPPANSAQIKGQSTVDQHLPPVSGTPLFKYDKVGNRLQEEAPGSAPISYSYNQLNQCISRGGTQYFYDLNGNLQRVNSNQSTSKLLSNSHNKVIEIEQGGSKIQFRYDALGRLIRRDEDDKVTYFVFDDENVVEERDGGGSVTAQYVSESEADSHIHKAFNGSEQWYHKDLTGSTILLSDISGAAVAGYAYSPFGRTTGASGTPSGDYLYTGRPHLSALDLVDLRARLYDSELGRFLQRDPGAGGIDVAPYTYADNNPLTRVDPHGHQYRDVYKLNQLMMETASRMMAGDRKGLNAVTRRLNTHLKKMEAGRRRGRAYAKGLGEGLVNLVLGAANEISNASTSVSPFAVEYSVNFTRPGPVWQKRTRLKDWSYTKEKLLNLTIVYPVGKMIGETAAGAYVADSSDYLPSARLEAASHAGRGTPGTIVSVLSMGRAPGLIRAGGSLAFRKLAASNLGRRISVGFRQRFVGGKVWKETADSMLLSEAEYMAYRPGDPIALGTYGHLNVNEMINMRPHARQIGAKSLGKYDKFKPDVDYPVPSYVRSLGSEAIVWWEKGQMMNAPWMVFYLTGREFRFPKSITTMELQLIRSNPYLLRKTRFIQLPEAAVKKAWFED